MGNDKARRKLNYEKKLEGARKKKLHNILKYSKGTAHHFYQFRRADTPHILYLLASHPLALRVFAILLYCADDGNSIKHNSTRYGIASIEQKYIGKAVSYKKKPVNNRSGVASAIQYLKKLGLITVKRQGVSNIYILNPEFVWVLHDNQDTRNKVENYVDFKNDPLSVAKGNKRLLNKFKIASDNTTVYRYKTLKTINKNEQAEERVKEKAKKRKSNKNK